MPEGRHARGQTALRPLFRMKTSRGISSRDSRVCECCGRLAFRIFAPINVPSSLSCSLCLKTAVGQQDCIVQRVRTTSIVCTVTKQLRWLTSRNASHRQSDVLPPHPRLLTRAFIPPVHNSGKGKRYVRFLHRRTARVIFGCHSISIMF